jgi:hypothetical protein
VEGVWRSCSACHKHANKECLTAEPCPRTWYESPGVWLPDPADGFSHRMIEFFSRGKRKLMCFCSLTSPSDFPRKVPGTFKSSSRWTLQMIPDLPSHRCTLTT